MPDLGLFFWTVTRHYPCFPFFGVELNSLRFPVKGLQCANFFFVVVGLSVSPKDHRTKLKLTFVSAQKICLGQCHHCCYFHMKIELTLPPKADSGWQILIKWVFPCHQAIKANVSCAQASCGLFPDSTCCWCSTGTGWSTYLLDMEEWASPDAPPRWRASHPIRSRLPPRLSWWKKDPKSEVRFCFPPQPWLKLSNHYLLIIITTLHLGGSSKGMLLPP